ncbi:hypothetical protein [Nostoc commune]|uniref:hypothetical protein n=1 Tax=Nostoc commune TaxID=1178 RepID=UPI0018C6DF63|nr:hypothetical protein [Nostoc commune]MBG1259153.1 hypothetical protein [Nostoc commune BAE]
MSILSVCLLKENFDSINIQPDGQTRLNQFVKQSLQFLRTEPLTLDFKVGLYLNNDCRCSPGALFGIAATIGLVGRTVPKRENCTLRN